MIRVFVVYEGKPDRERYAKHVEMCRGLPGGGTFRHGEVFGAPFGEPKFGYYAEWEFPDRDAFNTAMRSPEMAATAKDAMEMGVPFHVHFAEIE